jgi:hypothetical protein
MSNVIDFEKYRKSKTLEAVKELKTVTVTPTETEVSPEMAMRLKNIRESIQRINKLMEELRTTNSR